MFHNLTVKTVFFSTKEATGIIKASDKCEVLVRIRGKLTVPFTQGIFEFLFAYPCFSEDPGFVTTCHVNGKKRDSQISNLIFVFNRCFIGLMKGQAYGAQTRTMAAA